MCVLPGHRSAPRNRSYPATESRGNDRIANLVISCHTCNQAKGDQSLEDFLSDRPEALARVQESRRAPLKDAAVVNSTRLALYERLKATGLPVETGSGGLTKWNRSNRGLPKEHWVDAACCATPVMGIHCSGLLSYSCGKGVCSTSYSKVKRPARNTV